MGISSVSPLRVRTLLLTALDLFSKGDKDGKFWVQGREMTSSPVLGNRYGYCSIGAIHNVTGFSEAEKRAAKIALAKMIDRDFYGGDYLDGHAEYDGYDYVVTTFEKRPELADDLIVEINDDEETQFEQIRGWFSDAAAFLKRK